VRGGTASNGIVDPRSCLIDDRPRQCDTSSIDGGATHIFSQMLSSRLLRHGALHGASVAYMIAENRAGKQGNQGGFVDLTAGYLDASAR